MGQVEEREGEQIRMEEMMDWRTGRLGREDGVDNITLIKEIREKMGINKHDSVEIYTAESKVEKGRVNGVAIVVKEDETETWREEGYSINNKAIIFTTEVIVIERVLEIAIMKYEQKDVIIFTDSMSAIAAILNEKDEYEENTRIGSIRGKLMEREKRSCNNRQINSGTGSEGKLRLAWIPAHVGISGNEKADAVAKESTRGIPDNVIKIPAKDIQTGMENQAWRKSARDMKEEGRYKGVKYFSLDNNKLVKKPHGFKS